MVSHQSFQDYLNTPSPPPGAVPPPIVQQPGNYPPNQHPPPAYYSQPPTNMSMGQSQPRPNMESHQSFQDYLNKTSRPTEAVPPPIVQKPGNYPPNQRPPPGYYGQPPPNMAMGYGQPPPNMAMGYGPPQYQTPPPPGFLAVPPPMLIPIGPIPGVPIGLEPLVPLSVVLVKQQIELLEVVAGIETANKYDVLTVNGQRIYFAGETTDGCSLACGGSNRLFTIDIRDSFGRTAMTLRRVDDGCCTAGIMTVTLGDGSRLGEVSQVDCCEAEFQITDENNLAVMVIKGPDNSCCYHSTVYPITTAGDGADLGVIRKTFAGFVQEYYTDADNFGVEFPVELNVRWKALMFAAVFLIDFLYFESTPNRHQQYHHY